MSRAIRRVLTLSVNPTARANPTTPPTLACLVTRDRLRYALPAMNVEENPRFVRWQGRTITQLGFVNNTVLALTTASLGFAAITCYEDARRRGMQIHGYRVCSMEDIIESKRASNRLKDRESLPRLRDYAVYLEHEPHPQMWPLPARRRGRLSPTATDPEIPAPGSSRGSATELHERQHKADR